jgi:hypothetical protein
VAIPDIALLGWYIRFRRSGIFSARSPSPSLNINSHDQIQAQGACHHAPQGPAHCRPSLQLRGFFPEHARAACDPGETPTPFNVIGPIVDTPSNLEVNWEGTDVDNGQYCFDIANPALVNWRIISAVISDGPGGQGGGEPWMIDFVVQHLIGPHPEDINPGLPLALSIPAFDYTSSGVGVGSVSGSIVHPTTTSPHGDSYRLSYDYYVSNPPFPQKNLKLKLTGVHQVPGPLPVLGVGVSFGLMRRMRSRIKSASLA